MISEAAKPFFAFEKEMNQYMKTHYDSLGCTYVWDDLHNNFTGDEEKDVTLYNEGKTILIEHKFRQVEYPDILVETDQDVESNNIGWIYKCGADLLHYIICKTIEGIMRPIYYHRIKLKLFKDWFICWREVEHPEQRISKRGYGRTINLVVPLNIIPPEMIQKEIMMKEEEC